jgi:hypothetical protein
MEEGIEVRDITKAELAVCRERLLRDNAQLSARVRRLEHHQCPLCRALAWVRRPRTGGPNGAQ